MVEQVVEFDQYSEPMKRLLESFAERPETDHVVSSAHPHLVNGTRSTNPRYLQRLPDLANPRERSSPARLAHGIPADQPVYFPVGAGGKKAGLPPLAVYSPIHYQELPELFMDFICSLTGKSPATTGFALTKAAFNAMPPVVDLNNALVSFILTGYAASRRRWATWGRISASTTTSACWSRKSGAACVCTSAIPGFSWRVDTWKKSAISAWTAARRWPAASATGSRLFSSTDSWGGFSKRRMPYSRRRCCGVARQYFEDGSVEAACPPLQALLHIMANGSYHPKGVEDAEVRGLFTREYLMASGWYRQRLCAKQTRDVVLWTRHVRAIEEFRGLEIEGRLAESRQQLAWVSAPEYLDEIEGTIGADPFGGLP